jgi:hypothetical protein
VKANSSRWTLIVLGLIIVGMLLYLGYNQPVWPPTPTEALGRGALLVLSTPTDPDDPSDQGEYLIVSGDPTMRQVRRGPVLVLPADEPAIVSAQISAEHWQALAELRSAWCADTPDYPQIDLERAPEEPIEPHFDVGIQCTGGLWNRRILIPADAALPPELERLLTSVSSPQADDEPD